MTIGIMQPYLFPYLGYWQLINTVDTFVIYDNIEYTKKSWINRNNILINGKKTLFSIPLKKDSDYLNIKERYLSEESEKDILKILRQVKHSYSKAPFFEEVYPLIEKIFLNEEKNLFEYVYFSIKEITNYCKIETKLILSSSLEINHNLKSEEKVIRINKCLNSDNYINSIGGRSLYSSSNFNKEGLSLFFLESSLPFYNQNRDDFISSLSIIDILMHNSKNEIKEMLEKFHLVGEKI